MPVSLRTAREIGQALGVDLPAIMSLNSAPDDHLMAALKAADDIIERILANRNEWGVSAATTVLALLVARYGSAIAQQSGNRELALMVVQVAFDQAKAAILGTVDSG